MLTLIVYFLCGSPLDFKAHGLHFRTEALLSCPERIPVFGTKRMHDIPEAGAATAAQPRSSLWVATELATENPGPLEP